MGITIKIEGITTGKDAKILNGAKFKADGDYNLEIRNNQFKDGIELFNNMEMGEVMKEIGDALQEMDTSLPEYKALNKLVLNTKGKNEMLVQKRMMKHIGKFAGGVLENIIANAVTGKI